MAFIADAFDMITAWPVWAQRLLLIAVVLVLAWVVKGLMDRWVRRALIRSKHIDDTARDFVVRIMDGAIWAVTFVVVLGIAGVDTVALMGGLAVGGFIVGFALKDTLGNLAAGLMLLIYRPFSKGDTVTIDGESGDIVELGMALTTIKSADGRIITLPNGNVLGGTITNHTREPARRADVQVGIGYDDDIDTVVKAILDALNNDDRVLSEPVPSVRITDLGDSAVGLQVRPWVRTDDFWQAKADFHGVVKRAVEAAGGSIPFPQQDVHIIQPNATD